MAGNNPAEDVADFLSRLLDQGVSPDTKVRLRSVQRAAFLSWARKQGLQVREQLLIGPAPVSALDLLATEGVPETAIAAPASPAAVSFGIGIDIEDVTALPYADDYRDHTFFQDHFTPAEISYCLLQADVRASLCGTWATKEALLKAGLSIVPFTRLCGIEIGRDSSGRPTFPGWHISISHTPGTAVAVCMPQPAPLLSQRAESSIDARPQTFPQAKITPVGKKPLTIPSTVGIATSIALAVRASMLRLLG